MAKHNQMLLAGVQLLESDGDHLIPLVNLGHCSALYVQGPESV